MKRIVVFLILLTFTAVANFSFAENAPSFSILNVEFQETDNMTSGEANAYKWAKQGQENPIWSPDGSKIAFAGRGGEGLWIVSAEGGEARLIHENLHAYEFDGVTHTNSGLLTAIAFSADGSEIYFHDWSTYEDSHIAGGRCNNPKIKAVTIRSGDVRVLVEKANAYASFTQDGRYCIYLKKTGDGSRDWGGIFVKDLVSGDERSLGVRDGSYVNCLSPDGKSVIFSSSTENPNQLYQVPLDGGQTVKITNFDSDDECYSPIWPNYSPDGKCLYFLATYRDWWDTSGFYRNGNGSDRRTNYLGICSMDIESGNVLQITPNTDYIIRSSPQLSPDGSLVIYQAGQCAEGQGLSETNIHIAAFKPVPFSKPTAVETVAPAGFTLKGNYPNPFNPTTTIEFTLERHGEVRLSIYNTAGQLVRELVNGELTEGSHSSIWDGLDDNGNSVSSGLYLYRLKSGSISETKSMTLIR